MSAWRSSRSSIRVTAKRVHADRQVLAMIFEDAEGQDDRPVVFNCRPDLVRQHRFIAHVSKGGCADPAVPGDHGSEACDVCCTDVVSAIMAEQRVGQYPGLSAEVREHEVGRLDAMLLDRDECGPLSRELACRFAHRLQLRRGRIVIPIALHHDEAASVLCQLASDVNVLTEGFTAGLVESFLIIERRLTKAHRIGPPLQSKTWPFIVRRSPVV